MRLAPLLLLASLPLLAGGTIEGLVLYERPPEAAGRLRIRCVGETGAKKQETEFVPSPALVFLEDVRGSFPPPTAHATMAQRGLTFLPHVLPIVVGATVDFPNEDDLQHNVFSYSPTRRFDLGRYCTGDSRPVTFDRVGLVRVCCEIHSHMKGFIIVLQNPYFAFAGTDGRYRIEDVPVGTYRVSVWHEDYKLRASTVEVTEDEPARSDFSLTRASVPPPPEAPSASPCGCKDDGSATSSPLVRLEPLPGSQVGEGLDGEDEE